MSGSDCSGGGCGGRGSLPASGRVRAQKHCAGARLFRRHPLVWLLIPAGLLIYFVYVSLGWNLWVSVSDWEAGSLEASYGWGGFDNYARMFTSDQFWPTLKNTLCSSA